MMEHITNIYLLYARDYDEYRVTVGGESYYTDDRDDAEGTGRMMAQTLFPMCDYTFKVDRPATARELEDW